MLIFVYNANSGSFNAILDSAHKILSPSTYQCQLCQLSYGLLKENEQWKQFREGLSDEVVFLHKDEFEQRFEQSYSYPVLLRQTGEALKVLLDADRFNQAKDTQALISLCRQVIEA